MVEFLGRVQLSGRFESLLHAAVLVGLTEIRVSISVQEVMEHTGKQESLP